MNEIVSLDEQDRTPSLVSSLTARHKPDILDCIANLSSDEVFTSPGVVNRMLDLLPEDVWTNPDLKFLDPGCKSGVFLREAAKRLMEGLAQAFPDPTERRAHIFRNMLYGIAITELTAQIARRSLYYTKDASSDKSVVQMDSPDGNIVYRNIQHTYVGGSCTHCGAPESAARDDSFETHAYLFIHQTLQEIFPDMKFDVIIGNPPYQLKDGGHGASASPLYHRFVQNAIKLNPRYVSMIIPARWYAGGKGLDEFRAEMLADRRIAVLADHADASECFPGVEIKGGVCYFLWDEKHGTKGGEVCTVRNIAMDKVEEGVRRLDDFDVFIRFNKAVSILNKIRKLGEPTLDAQVSPRKPFGFPTNFDAFSKTPIANGVRLYARGQIGWVARDEIAVNPGWIDSWKVLVSRAYGAGEGFPHQILGEPIIAEPNSCCTETYIVCGTFDTEEEAKNFNGYMRTRFFRFMVSLRKITMMVPRDVFKFVPQIDMSRQLTDADLYARYGLTPDEIAYIESMIKEMP